MTDLPSTTAPGLDDTERLRPALEAAGRVGDWSWDPTTDIVTLYDESGAVVGRLAVQDITEHARTKELLRERLFNAVQKARETAEVANRLKDEFLATVSHELRTPLNAVLGWTSLLRGTQMDEARRARALETIERNARLQQKIVEDILDVSRIIAGQLRLDLEPMPFRPVVEAAVESIRPMAAAKSIALTVELGDDPGILIGDHARLQQVVWNLLSNAVKFTPEGGAVRVSLDVTESRVELAISDTGVGIAPEFLPHVFERFRQGDARVTRAHGGLGLGLAIARHLTDMHGGSVAAVSAGDGKGATFIVRLPTA